VFSQGIDMFWHFFFGKPLQKLALSPAASSTAGKASASLRFAAFASWLRGVRHFTASQPTGMLHIE
jgi:hypothetical protein